MAFEEPGSVAYLYEGDKKIAKITFPVWLYVTITGVIVYIMISPFYDA